MGRYRHDDSWKRTIKPHVFDWKPGESIPLKADREEPSPEEERGSSRFGLSSIRDRIMALMGKAFNRELEFLREMGRTIFREGNSSGKER